MLQQKTPTNNQISDFPIPTSGLMSSWGLGVHLYSDGDIRRVSLKPDRWYILLCKSGEFKCSVPDGSVSYGKGLMVLPSQSEVKSIHVQSKFKGYMLSLPSFLVMRMDIWNTMGLLANIKADPFASPDDKEMETLVNFVTLIRDVLFFDESQSSWVGLQALCQAFVATCCKHYKSVIIKHVRSPRKETLTNEFLKLVSTNCTKERNLDFYAKKLNVSTKYLSSVVITASGKKAHQWIEEYTIAHAKEMLKGTNDSIMDISSKLNFKAPSDFCRYFRKSTGMTPRQFR